MFVSDQYFLWHNLFWRSKRVKPDLIFSVFFSIFGCVQHSIWWEESASSIDGKAASDKTFSWPTTRQPVGKPPTRPTLSMPAQWFTQIFFFCIHERFCWKILSVLRTPFWGRTEFVMTKKSAKLSSIRWEAMFDHVALWGQCATCATLIRYALKLLIKHSVGWHPTRATLSPQS